MAKAVSKTGVYQLQSRQTGETLFVTERARFKFEKIAGFVRRVDLRAHIYDKSGRLFERLPGVLMRCVETGEVFQIIEQAPSIRHESA